MQTFIEKICNPKFYNSSQVEGYNHAELDKLERLYDIKIQGDFRNFLSSMGRCDGGLIGDDPIVLYRSNWSVRSQITFQMRFFSDMQDANHFQYLKDKPFVFSLESDTQYYFLQTASDEPNHVYHYDENSEIVEKTGWTLIEYLKMLVERRAKTTPNCNVICRGELLLV